MKAPEPIPVNDTQLRIVVVGEQRLIEESLTMGSAIFVVQDMLTPLFISEEHVSLDPADGLYKLKNDDKALIPDGLIPEAKLNDPKQLSTVLGRVLSMPAMLKSGVEVTVVHVNLDRPKADNKLGFVDATNIAKLKEKYRNFHFQIIPQATYDHYKTKVCAATYCDEQSGEKVFTGIDASQINSTKSHHDWGVKPDEEVEDKVSSLNQLLNEFSLEPITKSKALKY